MPYEATRRNALLIAALAPFSGGAVRVGGLLVLPPEGVSHDPGPGAMDRPERLTAVTAALAQARFATLARATAPRASLELILRVHSHALIEKLQAATPTDGVRWLDRDLAMSPGTCEAALHAAGGGALAVERVLKGQATNAFVAARPPGHHALPNEAMGFCFINNAAIAARHAMALGAERVAIVDFDLHHGNGLQEIFWNEKNVLYCSTHQSPLYPGTGRSRNAEPSTTSSTRRS